MKQAVAVAAALCLTGCAGLPFGSTPAVADLPSGLRLAIQPQSAGAGTNAIVSIHNGSSEAIGYNLCFGGLEQRRGKLWVPALTQTEACPQVFSTLGPGEQASAETPLAPTLQGGDYRYVTRVQVPVGGLTERQIRSDPIRIAPRGS